MSELSGVLSALLSSALGGTAVAVTRYAMTGIDPFTLGAFRFGIGFICLLPVTLLMRERWPAKADWPAITALGMLFFGVFPVLFNLSLAYTTSARAALSLSSLPLLTMIVAAAFGIEQLTLRKTIGVLSAFGGVALGLAAGLQTAPDGALFGDFIMVAAALCMALYSVLSRPFLARSSPLTFTTVGMGVGAMTLTIISIINGVRIPLTVLGIDQIVAISYLGIVCGAVIFFLWSFALSRTTPTKVAISVTVNPITASIVGSLLIDEPIQANVMLGLVLVAVGIVIATSSRQPDA